MLLNIVKESITRELFERKSSEERVVYNGLNQRHVDSEKKHGGSSIDMYYIGLDVHRGAY